jgi:hypothetical protein
MSLFSRLSEFVQSAPAGRNVLATDSLGSGPLRRFRRRPVFAPTPKSLGAYKLVLAQKVAMIDRLPKKYQREAEQVVWDAVLAGYDAAALAKNLHDRFGISSDRAQLLARIQCFMARSVIENAHRIELGLTEAVWICSPKHPEEPAHVALNGRRYPLSTGVTLNNKSIWPGSEPGCFCTSVVNSADDEG